MTHKRNFDTPDLTVEGLSKALYKSNQMLQKTIHERDEFFANISHDLRSPVTAIHNSIEYLQSLDHISEQDIKSALPLLYERTLVLEKMINDIFFLTRLDSSESLLHMEVIPAAAFLEDFYFMCDANPLYHDRRLILDVPEDLSVSVLIDPAYLKRVLDNLYSNALKYTQQNDSITLSASITPDHFVRISVSDTGRGISAANTDRIFERTYMESSARTPSEHSGAGLGLAICKSIIEKHGGKIWCESDAEHHPGSIFTFTLPVHNNPQ